MYMNYLQGHLLPIVPRVNKFLWQTGKQDVLRTVLRGGVAKTKCGQEILVPDTAEVSLLLKVHETI